jgi:hypothetical protein
MKHVVEHKNRGRERKGKRATHYNIYTRAKRENEMKKGIRRKETD